MFPDVHPGIDWARIALRQDPEAINIWIGTERSTTALHKDNYENVYVQIIGQKHFVLLPPVEGPCVNDVVMPQGVYEVCMLFMKGGTSRAECNNTASQY